MKDAYIVQSVRTPGCKQKRGLFNQTRPEELITFIMKQAVEKTPNLTPDHLDDVMIGCAFPEGEQGLNIGRVAVKMAGFPDKVSGATVNRFCASGLEAIALASMRVQMGWSDVTMGAGLESMTYVPMGGNNPRPHPEYSRTNPEMYVSMGITAENVAERYNISRQDQDTFAAASQAKAARARDNGLFTEIVPTPAIKYVKQDDGTYKKETFIVKHDDGIRESTPEGLGKLRTVFKANGSVTAGNSSQTTDGAAATIIASKEKCEELGLTPIARLVSYATIGCKSDEMGVGPRYAIPKVLEQAGLTIDDIDIYEINEAFASQALYCIRELDLEKYMDRINIHGGAIALGHPLGCTGAKLTATCLANLKEVNGKYGIVSMCIGGGMGAAAIFERL
ncbi:thiolase family protein [Desulfotignum phosphitoxidans]|uniref:acetyl-CoA C-acyltransferase n=1 Tax=Desulfotignum phosphitoxidans DSM 13687 TaxID=1286635 RepID=S0G3F8_9BACT|nr:thiolase family protein [Desulfotignum phosphitoxidans]EMS78331.1 acetyl-CoA acyltransferase FadA [Desulfotignum phosphitoxidans DSM 13687]